MRPPPIQRRGWRLPWAEAIADAPDVALMATSPCDALRTSTLRDDGAGVERLLLAAADLRRPLPAEQPADAFWWRIVGEEARHRSTTPKAPRMRGLETPLSREAERHAKSVSRRRTGCCIGLIDQARPWGVRRRRAQLRVAMSRPRGTPWRACSVFIRVCSPELAGLPNSFCVKVTTQGTDTTLWK
jgi:hypothetical protein